MCRHVAGIEPGLPGWRGVIEGSPRKEEQVEAPGRGEPIPCEVWEAQRSGAWSKGGKRGCKPREGKQRAQLRGILGLSQAFLHPPGWLREPKVSTALLGLTVFGRSEESGVNALVSHLMAAKACLPSWEGGRRPRLPFQSLSLLMKPRPAPQPPGGQVQSIPRTGSGVGVSALWPQGTSPWAPESGR